jgi:hypothetical protein
MADPMADHHTGYKQKILKETLFITRNLETATFPQKVQEKRERTIFSCTIVSMGWWIDLSWLGILVKLMKLSFSSR